MNHCDCKAAVVTSVGSAAIGTIQISGKSSLEILSGITKNPLSLETGKFCIDYIVNQADIIDHVVIGRESEYVFTIHCHGNPLIIEKIMELLKAGGAELISTEKMLEIQLPSSGNIIKDEAARILEKACTLAGVKIIHNQLSRGLLGVAEKWLEEIDVIAIEDLHDQCHEILQNSKSSRLLIEGAKIAIVGMPNSGKSTLFNALCGSEKAIVTEIAGTTRDWLSSPVQLGPLYAEIYDTAGLDEKIAAGDKLETAGQIRTKEILDKCDIILQVVDLTDERPGVIPLNIKDKTVLRVLNKCDLLDEPCIDAKILPGQEIVRISAKNGTGLDGLVQELLRKTGIDESIIDKPVAFTFRQKQIISQLGRLSSKSQAKTLIEQLLTSPEPV